MSLNSNGYKLLKLSEPNREIKFSFENLPSDPYCPGRFRRFSQYQAKFKDSKWNLTLLPKSPHIQDKVFNKYVGGISRNFEQLVISPSIYTDIVLNELSLSRDKTWHVDVHQWRTLCILNKQVSSVPEGVHRDGHSFGAILVIQRKKIIGGETKLYHSETSKIPFFNRIFNNLEGIIFDDRKFLHYTTDIKADGKFGYRDIFVINVNLWEKRRYGDAFEKSVVCK